MLGQRIRDLPGAKRAEQVTYGIGHRMPRRPPELALDPEIAAVILLEGMKGGMFTGVGLTRYFNEATDDPVNARRIINGTDHAADIAALHAGFLAGLS